MAIFPIEHLARGRFSFLGPGTDEIRQVLPRAEEILPRPQQIFLEDEDATPLSEFPILLTPGLRKLEEVLADYLGAEEEAAAAYHKREPFDSRSYASRWERYRTVLGRVLENVTLGSHGGNFPSIFCLYQSIAVARYIHGIPLRLRRQDLNLGRDHGDEIKYKVFSKWSDRAVELNRQTAERLAAEMVEEEAALFPELLKAMRDNVMIFTEDYVSPDLSELGSYFNGYMGIDGRDFRLRFSRLEEWHRKNLDGDDFLKSAVTHLLGREPEEDGRALLNRPGYITFLSSHVTYSPAQLLSNEHISAWEELLRRIKQFEIFCALRKMVVPLEPDGEDLICRDPLNTTWVGTPANGTLRRCGCRRPPGRSI